MLRRRQQAVTTAAADPRDAHKRAMEPAATEQSALLAGDGPESNASGEQHPTNMTWSHRNKWIVYAVASGACAALNGVMAKLTTTELTSSFSQSIARVLGMSAIEGTVEAVVRAGFFGLNLLFNGVMWTLFTQALAKGNSTTQVSIMNTSSNFVLTALLGLVIFSESLPPLWWLGASMLVAGNVIIGRKDESCPTEAAASSAGSGYEAVPQADGVLPAEDKDDEDIPELGNLSPREEAR
ncbi:hypothetical protein MCOR27_000340 [Pyricularia oryzae]|uniref:EamA domain-containing protein n=3 Tax=Pyricularia TaxID=48558 RepID=A0ABQ8NRD9_PYRGI|nr:uncharacterized protein MGG_13208 [Pyricularia oryzae 70-15]KAH8847414.1 hypothetical protein MCOR01_000846 [Pyricularia oryzae]KAI6300864.1 hypothetical protein MCOR33_003490 [Pyricularia grisea]EHA52165.1 hypothetical protein MGG_13208 [Pyricularia oryzae 70-15]KAH9428389.1 hypothetical protein MCOR02_010943 [Pyricularia oryzae]KAI6259993.1 hypothetical protein MCOR19_003715 [Pyricularia oryzae]